jgi:hypothetical protein
VPVRQRFDALRQGMPAAGQVAEQRPRQARGMWGSAMKVVTAVIAAGLVGFIIFNIINRDDIIRYFKMRQM